MPWAKTAEYSVVASRMPDCMRRHAMPEAGLEAKVEVFAPVRFNHDGSLPLRVFPFFWTAAGVRAFGADAGQLRRHIAEWAARWFGLVDPRAVEAIEEADLHGVIHRVQYVEAECTADCIAVEVDLGSSHVEALMTLLDAIKVCGASEVRVGDPTLTAG